jgi:hypothetical protein
VARIRTIKPEFATDEKLAKVSRDARLTFVLCLTQADDDGLIPGNHRQLLAALYPLDDSVTYAKLAAWVEELVEMGRVRWRETLDGSPILEIVSWAKHQKVDHKGKSLILPHLKPLGEEDASRSREIREEDATVSRSDLGPRTMDLRPPPVAAAPVKEPKAKRQSAPWMGRMAVAWTLGTLPPGSATLLAPVVAAVGEEETAARLAAYCVDTDRRFATVRDFVAKHATFAIMGGMVDPATGTLNAAGMHALGIGGRR